MSSDPDEPRSAQQSWLSTLNEARQNCRVTVAEAEAHIADPYRAVWPNVGIRQMGSAHKAAMQAHIAVIDYADLFRPYKGYSDGVEELWDETLDTVPIPGQGEMDVEIANLDEEWEAAYLRDVSSTEDELRGQNEEVQIKRILLPTHACRRCYRQLNAIARKLTFAAEPSENTKRRFHIAERGPDDYDDPVKDGIVKPQSQ